MRPDPDLTVSEWADQYRWLSSGAVRNRPDCQPGQTLGIGAVHPAPERLAVHPEGRGRSRAINPLEHQRNRKHPPCRPGILRLARRLQLPRRQFPLRDSNPRHAHLLPISPN